jgi:hypothetical protein
MCAAQRQDVGQRSAEGEGAPEATTFTSPGRGRAAGRSTVRGRRFRGSAIAGSGERPLPFIWRPRSASRAQPAVAADGA